LIRALGEETGNPIIFGRERERLCEHIMGDEFGGNTERKI